MSFSLFEVINSAICACVFGLAFSAIWALPGAIFNSPIITAVGVVLFGLGFVLVSYLCLDGIIRIYMLVLSISSFLLSKKCFFDKIAYRLKKMVKSLVKSLSCALDKLKEK